MDRVYIAIDQIREINAAYGLDNAGLDALENEIDTAKVCTPIIGKFSSGKSALVNALLGYTRGILKEDITPETAVPAEILYTAENDYVTVIKKDGTKKELSLDEYRKFEPDTDTDRCVRIHLNNKQFLGTIPDVMMVDMPGFESGYEVHNRAIDDYLPQSLAYIVTFPADDMIVRSSVGNILRELCLHDMPLCVVITKYDKRNEEDFKDTFEKMKGSLRRFLGERDICYCITSSRERDVEELKNYLQDIQEQSGEILARKYRKLVLSQAERTDQYLRERLEGSRLTESELAEKEERMKGQLSAMDSCFEKERSDFESSVRDCIEEIKNDVRCALESEESTFVAMALNNQSINEQMNQVIRNAVTISVKKRFIPRAEKYMKNLSRFADSPEVGDVCVAFHFDTENLNRSIAPVVAGAAGALAGGLLIGLLAGLIAFFASKKNREKKRQEAKAEIRRKLRGEVYPQVLSEVGSNIEKCIWEQAQQVNTSIEEEIRSQRSTLEKAMEDVRSQKEDEQQKKENLETDIKEDLERVADIKADLGDM
ncbi:MAG: dynamin family protein [Lachnospiraceae bacterium]|nr:dynamin family protein [Lachnospiraceae bacterium]